MGVRTGRPRGRPPGAANKSTLERQKKLDEIASQIGAAIDDAFEGDSHAFLMAVYKNPALPMNVRLDAAKAAISYEKPKLASVEHSSDSDSPLFPSTIEIKLVGS